MQIAPSTYFRHKQLELEPQLQAARTQQDSSLIPEIERVWLESNRNYGVRNVWKQLRREAFSVARCTVARLMRKQGLEGGRRGKKCKTTIPDNKAYCPQDLVNRRFHAERPNQLWVADITYVATWSGFVYVAFVIDVFSRRIVGWRAMKTMQTELILDALEQALWARGKPREGNAPQRQGQSVLINKLQ